MTCAPFVLTSCAALLGAAAAFARADLVVNGDFEDPSLLGVNSDYVHTPGGNQVEGSWWVSPWDPGAPWDSSQHTPSGAGAMSVNGDNSGLAGVKRVWFQTVAVNPGEQYQFSTWALGTFGGFEGYSLEFAFDGVQVGGTFSPSAPRIWEQFFAVITPTSSTVEISIVNVSGITFPNDFMLDDISLVSVPAPAGAALLGLGAVLAGRRRR